MIQYKNMWVYHKKCFYVESRVAQYFSLSKKNNLNCKTRIKKSSSLFSFMILFVLQQSDEDTFTGFPLAEGTKGRLA